MQNMTLAPLAAAQSAISTGTQSEAGTATSGKNFAAALAKSTNRSDKRGAQAAGSTSNQPAFPQADQSAATIAGQNKANDVANSKAPLATADEEQDEVETSSATANNLYGMLLAIVPTASVTTAVSKSVVDATTTVATITAVPQGTTSQALDSAPLLPSSVNLMANSLPENTKQAIADLLSSQQAQSVTPGQAPAGQTFTELMQVDSGKLGKQDGQISLPGLNQTAQINQATLTEMLNQLSNPSQGGQASTQTQVQSQVQPQVQLQPQSQITSVPISIEQLAVGTKQEATAEAAVTDTTLLAKPVTNTSKPVVLQELLNDSTNGDSKAAAALGQQATPVKPVNGASNQSQEVVQAAASGQGETQTVVSALQSTGRLTLEKQSKISGKDQVTSQDKEKTSIAGQSEVKTTLIPVSAGVATFGQDQQTQFSFKDDKGFGGTDNQTSSVSDISTFAQALQGEQKTAVTMNHGHVSADTQTTSTKDSFQIMQQIVDQAKLISRDQNSEMVIKLNPEHLGELTVKVTVEHTGLVTASFHSSNSDVRAVIESSLIQLKQELANSGLKVDNVGVYTSLNQFMSNQERPTQQQPKLKFSSKRNGDTFDDAVDALEKTAVTGADGVDYLV